MRTRAQASIASILLAVALTAGLTAAPAHAAVAGETVLASGITVPATTTGSSSASMWPASESVSSDGRYVAFVSDNDRYASDTPTAAANVFRKDRVTGNDVLIDRPSGVTSPQRAGARHPVISADGNRVAFISADRLTADDHDDVDDVYVRDITAGTTTLATPDTEEPVTTFDFSGDGQHVAFETTSPVVSPQTGSDNNVYERDLSTGVDTLVSAKSQSTVPGNKPAGFDVPSISDDGRWVAFASTATDLVPGYVAGIGQQIFLRDTATANTYLVSSKHDEPTRSGADGWASGPFIAGRPTSLDTVTVGFSSTAADTTATNTGPISNVYVRTMSSDLSSTATLIQPPTQYPAAGPPGYSASVIGGISDDGTTVIYQAQMATSSTGTTIETFLYNRDDHYATNALITAGANPAISGDGSYGVWTIGTGEVQGVPLRNGRTEWLAAPRSTISSFSVSGVRPSADGRYVAFNATAPQLAGGSLGHPQVYRRDATTGAIVLVSQGLNGAIPIDATVAGIDDSGNRVAFITSTSLVPADTNSTDDVYVRDIAAGTTTLASRASGADGAALSVALPVSGYPAASTPGPQIVQTGAVVSATLSGDGEHVVFETDAMNLGVPGRLEHIYERDLNTQTTTIVDRADGVDGAADSTNAATSPSVSRDGSRVAFATYAPLAPGDPAPYLGPTHDYSIRTRVYVRDLNASTTIDVSRGPGLDDTPSLGSSPAISGDGTKVAFVTSDQTVAPEAGTWPTFSSQVVERTIATGINALVSRKLDGSPSAGVGPDVSLSGDGDVVAFESPSAGLLPAVDSTSGPGVFVRRMSTGVIAGPPAFGIAQFQGDGASDPALSADGQCLGFTAKGYNPVTGAAGAYENAYEYVVSGTCQTPQVATPGGPLSGTKPSAPKLTSLRLSAKHFTVVPAHKPAKKPKTPAGATFSFRLSTAATVTIAFDAPSKGRKVGKTCKIATRTLAKRPACTRHKTVGTITTKTLPAGTAKVAFTGKLGRRTLPPGAYAATLTAKNAGGSSKPLSIAFRIVRK